ncbi:MAG: cobyrinic acid a,c-diamide synthase, partial [Pseudomonadota bacterium]
QLQSLGFEIRAAEPPRNLPPLGQRIAVASDEAFGFVYPHIVSDWREQGAEIRFFSPLADQGPSPKVDAIFLPGGYPELHAGQLSNAHVFRDGMRTAAQTGCAIYGECGGYMVLGEALIDEHGAAHAMLGLLSHTTSFEKRERQLGYRKLKRIANARLPQTLYGHEFHYSTVAERGHDNPLFETADSKDQSLGKVGGARANVCGSYLHIIEAGSAS